MSTSFGGSFTVSPPLLTDHRRYLEEFSTTRRMSRDPVIVGPLPDPRREAAGLPVGVPDAGYYTGASEAGVLDQNRPPVGQPSLWCQWVPDEDGVELSWDGGEKFYCYVEWLEFLLQNFLIPWGYVLHGTVTWEGDEKGDTGTIYIKKHRVQAIPNETVSPEPQWEGEEESEEGCDDCGCVECECCPDCEHANCVCDNTCDDCGCVDCVCGEDEGESEP